MRAACFLVFATVRELTLSSESELGSSIRCRLAGFGRAGWRVVVVPLFNQGNVLAMTVVALERWRPADRSSGEGTRLERLLSIRTKQNTGF